MQLPGLKDHHNLGFSKICIYCVFARHCVLLYTLSPFRPLKVLPERFTGRKELAQLLRLPMTPTPHRGPGLTSHSPIRCKDTSLPAAPHSVTSLDLDPPSPADSQATHTPHPACLHSMSRRHQKLSSPRTSPLSFFSACSFSCVFSLCGSSATHRVLQALQLPHLITINLSINL